MYLKPGEEVEKVGRTTETTHGFATCAVIQSWSNGAISVKIGVLACQTVDFAASGDSGSLLVVRRHPQLVAGELLTGLNTGCGR